MGIEKLFEGVPSEKLESARGFRSRLLRYQNPVEFVNNMYGCHPDDTGDDDGGYFTDIYH